MSRQAFWISSVSKKMRHISGVPAVRLALLFIASVLLTLGIAGGDAAAGRLFQSPQSPPAAPPPAIEQQAQPPSADLPPAVEPAQPAPAEPAQPPPAVEQAQPEAQQVIPEQPQSNAPAEPLVPAAEEAQPFQDQAPAEPDTGRSPDTSRDPAGLEEEPSDSQNFIMDRAEFIDSVIVSGAYIWACCGIGLLLLVPVFLLVLEIRGRSKIRRQD